MDVNHRTLTRQNKPIITWEVKRSKTFTTNKVCLVVVQKGVNLYSKEFLNELNYSLRSLSRPRNPFVKETILVPFDSMSVSAMALEFFSSLKFSSPVVVTLSFNANEYEYEYENLFIHG